MQVCSRSLPDDPSTAILTVGVLLIRSMRKVITLLGGMTEKSKAAIKVRAGDGGQHRLVRQHPQCRIELRQGRN